MKKLNRPTQPRGRLKLGKLCGSFLLVYGLSSAAFLYVCAHFPHRPEEETQLLTEKKNFLGNRMSLRRTVLPGDWRRKGRLEVCHLHKMPLP